jgi:uncharacterized Zn finger protein (UPF0148 family)
MPRPQVHRSTTLLPPELALAVATQANWRCPRCGYNLTGTPTQGDRVLCPECGRAFVVTATLSETIQVGAGAARDDRGDKIITGCAEIICLVALIIFTLSLIL